jgi:pentatricopeptide repeat protein
MARSMRRASSAVMPAGFKERQTFHHKASDRNYILLERDGKFFQRRSQVSPRGGETNVFEREIHYVVGSGNHAKSFLHRSPNGRLTELPLAWYAEGAGTWNMNPGYDRPDHPDFRREVPQECVFCHDAYPAVAGSDTVGSEPVFPEELPAGIDCQRCHGPGRDHIQAAGKDDKDRIRKAIVNPARLSSDRQLEICMQCHLETTSARLPNAILRWDRGAFSFRPGEPLEAYAIHFDHAAGRGRDDKFEIASHAYRLRKSECFEKSSGKLTCTTCHNPHDPASREQASAACRNCHSAAARTAGHPNGPDCVSCHMPRRRTEDVVHVVMTDHLIRRKVPAGDFLAPRRERADSANDQYEGPVVLYYPAQLQNPPESDLYLAVAQVKQFSNLRDGVPRLTQLLDRHKPANASVYVELAEAYDHLGQADQAVRYYRDAVNRAPNLRPAKLGLAQALTKTGEVDEALKVLQSMVERDQRDARAWNGLGLAEIQRRKQTDAIAAFRRAIEADPEYPEAYNNLAGALAETGDRAKSSEMYREALRLQPDLVGAHLGLARLAESFDEAEYHFKTAVSLRPGDAGAHYEYGIGLANAEIYGQAATQFETAARLKPTLAEAYSGLGDMLAIQNKPELAIPHYRRALSLRPDLESARTGLEMITGRKR